MRNVTVAATQMSCSWDIDDNISRGEQLVRKAAAEGANIILLQELFETPYFCAEQDEKFIALARTVEESRVVQHFSKLARELGVVLDRKSVV